MENFPKKYNKKKIIRNLNKNYTWTKIYSPSVPLDQKITPWEIFFMYFKDMYCKIHDVDNQEFQNITWYTVSSIYHSSLDTQKSSIEKIQLIRNIQKNKVFLENLWLDVNNDTQYLSMTEKFNSYLRQIFADFFSNKNLSYSQSTVNRSKSYQTYIDPSNIVKKEVEMPEYTIKYFIGTKGQAINVVTDRIETIFADVAIAVNPIDKRYKKLIGQNVLIPIINKNIPIIWDDSVDVFCGEWAVRVTPWHDEFWLKLAQKHGLPTDIFAIDIDWKFTEHAWEFAWKYLSDFFDNIIKYVDDIGNLESQRMKKGYRYFHKSTDEELFPMSIKQRSLSYDYAKDYLLNYLQEQDLPDKEYFCNQIEWKTRYWISNKSSNGLLIPIVSNSEWANFLVDDETIIKIYDNTRTRKSIAMTLIIMNLILDNNLPEIFTLQDLIQALFSRNITWDKTKLQEYIDIYTVQWQKESLYKNWLKSLNRLVEWIEKNAEKVDLLLEILEDSFAIQIDNDDISINYHDLFKVWWLQLQKEDSFNKSFIDNSWLLYHLWCSYSSAPYTGINPENNSFMTIKEEDYVSTEISLLALQYSKRNVFSDTIYAPVLVDQKWDKITNYNSKFLNKDFYENLNRYGLDVMRLTLLLWENGDDDLNTVIFDTYKANEYSLLIDKIRNANRYIFWKYKEKYNNWPIKINDILFNIQEWWITEYDNWMLHNMKMILEDYNYQLSEKKYLSFWKKLIDNYSQLFCDKYVNITKIINNDKTKWIMILIWILFLDLCYPFIPNIVSEIKSKFNIDYQGINIFNLNTLELKEKNYKINILSEVVDKINQMKQKIGLKKHEVADVFVQANPDLLNFLHENESIFRLLTKIQSISLLRSNEEIPKWCEIDNVINILVWVKKPDVVAVEIKKDVLVDLETEYREKVDHLQHLKALFASIYWNADDDLVEKKRQEIANLQNDIEGLEFKIGKLKINH